MTKLVYDKGTEEYERKLVVLDKKKYSQFNKNGVILIIFGCLLFIYVIGFIISVELLNIETPINLKENPAFLGQVIVMGIIFIIIIIYIIKIWDTSSYKVVETEPRDYVDFIDSKTLKITREYLK